MHHTTRDDGARVSGVAGSGYARFRWHDLTADATELVMLLDADLTLRYVNRLRPGEADPIGTSVLEFTPPAYHQALRDAVADTLERGHPSCFELEVSAPENETSWYNGWVVSLPETSSERLAIIAENVTDRYRTERALAAEKGLFRSLVDNAPDHVMIVDRERRAQFVNRLEPGLSLERVAMARVASGPGGQRHPLRGSAGRASRHGASAPARQHHRHQRPQAARGGARTAYRRACAGTEAAGHRPAHGRRRP